MSKECIVQGIDYLGAPASRALEADFSRSVLSSGSSQFERCLSKILDSKFICSVESFNAAM